MAPDDIVAIASLLRDPSVELLAITVTGTGEAHCRGGMFVARAIVTMLVDEPIPVTCGREEPFGDAQPFPQPWREGADAGSGLALVSPTFAPDERPAPDLIVELAAARADAGQTLTVLTLGTLTNIASALQLDPELPSRLRLVSMLGAVGVPGNVQPDTGAGDPVAEWNAHADPTAARLVLTAGFDITIVPLDATNSVPMNNDLYLELESDHVAGPADLVYELWARNPFMREGTGFYLWDPLAAAAVRDRSLVTTREASVRVVEGAGLDGGRLVEEPTGSRVIMATGADRPAFEAFLLSRLRLGPPRANAFEAVATLEVTIHDERCEARLEPERPPAGLVRVTVVNDGTGEQAAAVVFGLGEVPWSVVEEFAADPPLVGVEATAPPVVEVVVVQAARDRSTVGYGSAPAGQLGVACLTGTEERPVFTLAGPYRIGG